MFCWTKVTFSSDFLLQHFSTCSILSRTPCMYLTCIQTFHGFRKLFGALVLALLALHLGGLGRIITWFPPVFNTTQQLLACCEPFSIPSTIIRTGWQVSGQRHLNFSRDGTLMLQVWTSFTCVYGRCWAAWLDLNLFKIACTCRQTKCCEISYVHKVHSPQSHFGTIDSLVLCHHWVSRSSMLYRNQGKNCEVLHMQAKPFHDLHWLSAEAAHAYIQAAYITNHNRCCS